MLIYLIFIYNIYIIYKYSFRLCKWKSPKRPKSDVRMSDSRQAGIRISLTIQTEKVDSSYCIYSPSDFLAKLARKIPLKNGGFWTENLRASAFFRTFAVAMKMQRRLRAAAQRRPSELASAFTLRRSCHCQSEIQLIRWKASLIRVRASLISSSCKSGTEALQGW